MKKLVILILVCWGCGGKLSDEQRKRLHDGMATQDIKRISDADMQAAALKFGQSVFADLQKIDKSLSKKTKMDSFAAKRDLRIFMLEPNDSTLLEIEKALVDAYVTGTDIGMVGENLQNIGEDSILFTKPVFKDKPDGSQQFSYAIGIKMAKKTVILASPSL
ncbi:MAG: hypothetical protein HOP08_10900 [Cyclobacteriaceae bacterium]|nr:hypothetical protein [Cyclobacteriaceae bacterium]